MESPVFLLLAGEPSGDLHAARVARALRARWPGCRLIGMGGARMAAGGVELLAGLDELAVMGFVEVLSRLPFFWRLQRRVRRVVEEEGVDLIIPVDYPGFNLRITEWAHTRGIPVVYYIAPQVWAWKAGRTGRLARAAARIAVILPFEEELFTAEGGRAVFVGHPLLDRDDRVPTREVFCQASGLDPDRPILALFPGSRKQEIRRHLSLFLEAAGRIRGTRPEIQVAVSKVNGLALDLPEGTDATVVTDGRALLRHARAALVKSGTTTLEAALEGTPFVVAYRTHPITYRLAHHVIQVKQVALANLVVGGIVVPELLQDDATSEALAAALTPLLDDTEERGRILAGLARVRGRLGGPGAADRVADLVQQVMAEREAGSTHERRG